MSYMVLYTGIDGRGAFDRCEELPEAVAEVERLRNEQSIEDAKIFRLEEVRFEIKQYFRVEIPGIPAMISAPPPPPPAPATPMGFDGGSFATDDEAIVGSRRGLFGR